MKPTTIRLAEIRLKELADELGTVRAELKRLSALERSLAGQLKSELKAHGLKELQGDRYEVRLVRAEQLKVSPEGFYKLVPLEAFLKAVEVIPKRAREWVGKRELKEISEVIPVETLIVQERKRA